MVDVGQLLAWATAFVCALMLVRLCLSEPRRARVDRMAVRVWHAVQASALGVYHWRAKRQARAKAAVVAQAAIARAQHKVRREGNVVHPESFQNRSRGPSAGGEANRPADGAAKGPRKPH